MKIAIITTPFLTVEEHTNKMIASYDSFVSKKHELYKIAIINRAVGLDVDIIIANNDYVEINDENCLARAWNKGIKWAKKKDCDLYIISNLDVKLDPNTIDELVKEKDMLLWSPFEMREGKKFNYGYEESDLSFSFFAMKPECIDKVGYFDETFRPCYWEDVDYSYRMKLLNLPHKGISTCKFEHYGSSAIRDGNIDIMPRYIENMKYYIEKWGGSRGLEKFKTPFNK